MLAQRFSEAHPVLNMLMGLGVIALLAAVVVFHKPLSKVIHALTMWAMRAQGVADPEPPAEKTAVLWVGDRPEDGICARLAQEGVRVEVAGTTSEALDRLETGGYALIVSAMTRAEDGRRLLAAAGPVAMVSSADEVLEWLQGRE